MLDHQRIVDDIRSAMYSVTPESLDMLRLAVADYSVACDETNERLRQCNSLLKQGLRSEAIQACEVEPNLLDVVATLDFAERDQLVAITQQNGLAVPPGLSMEVASELNEAYAIQAPLESLLRQHRLLAIARGPLAPRLKTLRSIARLDKHNFVWQDDVRLFEKERLKEIQREANQAAKAGEVAVLDSLAEELADKQWQQKPPKELVQGVGEIAHRVRHKQTRKELEELEPALNSAFAAFDVEEGRRLRGRWNECVEILPLEGDPLADRVAPALDWLREQDEQEERLGNHEACVGALEFALDRHDHTIAELERLYHAAVRHGHDLSSFLERRYQAKIKGLEFAARRRSVLIITSVVSVVVLVAGVLAAMAWMHHRSNELAGHVAALSQLITDGKLHESQKYADELTQSSPRIAHSPEIEKLVVRLDEDVKKEQSRQEQFQHAIARVKAAGFDEPDHDALKRAEESAKTPAERTEVAEAKESIAKALRERQAERDKAFLADIDGLADKVKQLEGELEKSGADDDAASVQHFAQLRAELSALNARGELVTPAVRNQLKPLSTRLSALEEMVSRHAKAQAALNQLMKAVGDPQAYQMALQDYVKQHPESPHAASFQHVSAEAPLWEGMQRWDAFAVDLGKAARDGLTPAEGKTLQDGADKLLKELGQFPQAGTLRTALPHLKSVVARIGSDGPLHKPLVTLFNDRLIHNVQMIEHKDGRRWYTDKEPSVRADGVDIEFLAGFDYSHKHKPLTSGEIASRDRAPQAVVADKVLAELGKLDAATREGEWEQHFANILVAICEEQRMEPILKIALLKRVVPVACEGSDVLRLALAKHQEALEGSAVNALAPWMLPEFPEKDKDARKAVLEERGRAKGELEALADLPTTVQVAAKKPPPVLRLNEYRWIGLLVKDSKGGWTCMIRPNATTSPGALYVVEQPAGQKPVNISPIGHLEDGKPHLDSFKPALLMEGRPIYLLMTAGKDQQAAAVHR
ncbi:MAG: hypothetical protein HYX69_17880 [Planctomycetia bacterium]|nr:hypothetical protein [Planctomycetia bacterium]